jgi:DNA-binding IclR family transcriptional regulator
VNLEHFIQAHLGTIDHLRVLLHLKGTPRTEWDVLDVAAKLYLPPQTAAAVLAQLAAYGLAVASGDPPRYRYQPRTPELADLVERLAEMDRTQPVTLINMIYAQPKDVQAFADAFKLRKEKGN